MQHVQTFLHYHQNGLSGLSEIFSLFSFYLLTFYPSSLASSAPLHQLLKPQPHDF